MLNRTHSKGILLCGKRVHISGRGVGSQKAGVICSWSKSYCVCFRIQGKYILSSGCEGFDHARAETLDFRFSSSLSTPFDKIGNELQGHR